MGLHGLLQGELYLTFTTWSGVRDRVVMWDFVVDKVAPGQVSSEYFGFPCQILSTNCSKKSSSSSSINHRGYVQ
jgi:hypothetical protein